VQTTKEVINMTCPILRTTLLLLLASCLVVPCGLAAQATTTTTSRLQGTVFLGAHNEPTPGTKVTLYGDTGIVSTFTDRDGKFSFADVEPPGVYFLQASYLGLHTEQNVMVHPGTVVQVSLHLEAPDPIGSAKP
jgi:hypothetical protein